MGYAPFQYSDSDSASLSLCLFPLSDSDATFTTIGPSPSLCLFPLSDAPFTTIGASLMIGLFPLSDSDSYASFTIGPSLLLSLKWVLYPIVSDVAIPIAMWKHSHRQ